jgi:SOS response regulatory protein OraA/RecX
MEQETLNINRDEQDTEENQKVRRDLQERGYFLKSVVVQKGCYHEVWERKPKKYRIL